LQPEINESKVSDSIDPYGRQFSSKRFFQKNLDAPDDKQFDDAFDKALLFHDDLVKNRSTAGFSEILKTCIQGFLLAKNSFLNEEEISKIAISRMDKRGITLYRSLEDRRWTGRGFYFGSGLDTVYYTSFTLAR
jgi:hypothetical protein